MMNRGARAKMVSFTEISIRTFDLCMGDSPAVSMGVPLSLDWTFTESPPVSINEFESSRPQPRRTKEQMKIPAEIRHRKLVEDFGIPLSQIHRTMRRSVVPRKGIYRAYGSRNVKMVSPRAFPTSDLCQQSKLPPLGSSLNARPLELSPLSRRISTSKAA